MAQIEQIQELAYSERWLRNNCDWLVSKKFLKRNSRRVENISKPIYEYSYTPMENLVIPAWQELITNSSNSTNANSSDSSNTSNTRVIELIEQNETKSPSPHIRLDTGRHCSICGKGSTLFTDEGINYYCELCANLKLTQNIIT